MQSKRNIVVPLLAVLSCILLTACSLPSIDITGKSYPTTPDSDIDASLGTALNPDGNAYDESIKEELAADVANPEG